MTSVAVLGLGRMGSAMATRLADDHDVRTWSRSRGGSPADAVAQVEVVLLCLYDARACREVLAACLPALSSTVSVVNTTTVGPGEATELSAMVTATGATYLHAPVMGSTPAVAAGRLTILAGGKPAAEVEGVLELLGETLVFGGSAEAAALKLVANGVLGDSLVSLRRALARGDALGLPRDAVLDVVGRTVLGRFVEGRRGVLRGQPTDSPTTFAAGALAKDLELLAEAIDTSSDVRAAMGTLLADGALGADDDISLVGVATSDLSWLADARLDVSPEVVADADALRPLHAYALTHATGDPSPPRRRVPADGPHRGLPRRRLRLVGPRGLRRPFPRAPRRRRGHAEPPHRAPRRPRRRRNRDHDPPPWCRPVHRCLRAAA